MTRNNDKDIERKAFAAARLHNNEDFKLCFNLFRDELFKNIENTLLDGSKESELKMLELVRRLHAGLMFKTSIAHKVNALERQDKIKNSSDREPIYDPTEVKK